jgi:hypothetical protein
MATGKLYEGRIPLIGGIRSDHDRGAGHLRLCESIRQVRNLVSGHLPSVWIRKMAICHKHGQLAEVRLDPDSPVSVARPPDLDTRSMGIIGDEFALSEGKDAFYERGRRTRRRGFRE